MKRNTYDIITYYTLILFLIFFTIFQVYFIREFLELFRDDPDLLVANLLISLMLISVIFLVLVENKLSKFLKTVEFWTTFIYIVTPTLIFVTRGIIILFHINLEIFPYPVSGDYTNLQIFLYPGDISFLRILTGTFLINAGLVLVSFVWKENKFSESRHMNIRLYGTIRHPQYINFLIIIIGLLIQWPSIVRIIQFPFLIYMCYLLAKKKDKEMMLKSPLEYRKYMIRTNMFIPVKIVNIPMFLKIRKNLFFLLSILLFCSLTTYGYTLINNMYNDENPKMEWDLNPYLSIPVSLEISCETDTEIPVSGDMIWCRIEPSERMIKNNFENYSFADYSANISYSTGPLQSYYSQESIEKHSIDRNVLDYISIPIPIPIQSPGHNFIQFYVNITNKKTGKVLESGPPFMYNFINYRSISQEEYIKRQTEKFIMLFGIISLSLTLSFTSVRHLMEIWDRK